jgi:hypothetical protein
LGPYDTEILCEDCDGALGVFDQHAAEKLLHGERHFELRDGEKGVLNYPGANAELVMKFLASVAWRASKSNYKFFKRVELGPYEDELRRIFLSECNGSPKLDCIIAEYDKADVPQLDPAYTRLDGVRFVVLYASRFVFYVKVDKRQTPNEFQEFCLSIGRPVLSLVRRWDTTKESRIIMKLVASMQRPPFWKRR